MDRHNQPKPFTNFLAVTVILGSGLLGLGAVFPFSPVSVKMPKPPAKFSSFFHPPFSPGISPSPKRGLTPSGSILNQAWRIHRAISTSS